MANTVTVSEQLAADGYCIVDEHYGCDLLQYTSEVVGGWFEHASQQQKRDAAASPTNIAAGTGRGYFCVPAKEMLEVSGAWRGLSVGSDLKLAAKTVSTYTLMYAICATPGGVRNVWCPCQQFLE